MEQPLSELETAAEEPQATAAPTVTIPAEAGAALAAEPPGATPEERPLMEASAEPPPVPAEASPEEPALPETPEAVNFEAVVQVKDQEIAQLQAELAKRDEQNQVLTAQGAEYEQKVTSFQEQLLQKDAQTRELTERVSDLTGQFQRLGADFENFRRRTAQERENLVKFAGERVITNLLPIFDNFGRAMQAAMGIDTETLQKGIEAMVNQIKGLDMIRRQLDNLMQQAGVAPIPTVGERFDPNLHEAVMMEETTEYPDQTIIGELQTGYTLSTKVIRAAMVKVASNTTATVPVTPPATEVGEAQLQAPAEEAAEQPTSPDADPGTGEAGWEEISKELGPMDITIEHMPTEETET